LLLLGLAGAGLAPAASPISGSFDTTFASRYVAHGINIGDTEAQQATLNLTAEALPGFTFTYWNSLTWDRALQVFDEHDLLLKYSHGFFEGGRGEVVVSSYVDYWWYPNAPVGGEALQGLKYHLGFSLPKAIPLSQGVSLVPGYNFYQWHDFRGDQFADGAVHEFVLSSEIPLGLPESQHVPRSIAVRTALNYNTGCLGAEEGFSHVTLQLSTGAALTRFLSWHASMDAQWAISDQLNGDGDDIYWATFGLSATF